MESRDRKSIAQEAEHLVHLNQNEVRSIVVSYVFPDPTETTIRVVHLDSKAFPEEVLVPFAFAPDPSSGLHHKMQIAIADLTAPERLDPPLEWGPWSNAVKIERKKRRQAG